MARFSRGLRKKAGFIESQLRGRRWKRSIDSTIKREIALTLDQIKQTQISYEEQIYSLIYDECLVGEELLQIRQRTPRYASRRFPEEEKFKRRLLALKAERRHLSKQKLERIQSLETHLLSLVDRHDQIAFPENDNRQNSRKAPSPDASTDRSLDEV